LATFDNLHCQTTLALTRHFTSATGKRTAT